MANVSSLHHGRFLKAGDLEGRAHRVAIESLEVEPVGREKELKPVVYFKSSKFKPLILNVVNTRAIASFLGDETDDWAGRAIELYPDRTSFGAEIVDCVRVRAPKQAAVKAARPAVVAAPEEEPPAPTDDDYAGDSQPF